MKRTEVLQWPYPSYRDRVWFGLFEDLMSHSSSDAFAAIEDANLVIYGGGTISLNAGTGEVSWDEDIGVFSMVGWGKVTIPAGVIPGVADGKILCISLSRPVNTITAGTMTVVDSIDTIRTKTFFAKRVGDDLVMNNRYHSVLVGT